jgi:hypothetical protein
MAAIISPLLKRDCNVYHYDGYGCYKLPVGAIVGIAIGGVIFLFTIALIIFCCYKLRKRSQRRKKSDNQPVSMYAGALKPERIAFNPEAY